MKKFLLINIVCLLIGCSGREAELRKEYTQRVEESYAFLKAERRLPSDNTLEADAQWLETHGGKRYAGEAYYALGAYENLVGADSMAMHHLKLAESCWLAISDAPDALQGMTYYQQGRVSEKESLSEVALFHYRRALPFLLRTNDSLYISSVYREIARLTRDTAEQRTSFLQAVAYAESLSAPLRLDTRYAMLSALNPSSEERIAISEQLATQPGMQRYAADLARQALRKNDLKAAQSYLELLATDTAALTWSKHQYAILQAHYLYLSGQTAEAYHALELLYQQRIGDMETDGAARSYTIAERFDNAAQREENLQLQISRQRLYFALATIVIAVLIAACVLVLLISFHKNRRRQQQANLRGMLMQRVMRAGKMTNIFAQEGDWQEFCTTFDSAYDGMLDRLRHEYPGLTTADLQVLALMALGLSISDICLLLNQTKRTIWNRRQRIKEHMQLAQDSSLEDTIHRFM